MEYLFIGVFFLIGIYLVFTAIKEYRFLLLPAVYFMFLGSWRLADFFTEVDLHSGIYAWIVRAVSAVTLIITGLIYYLKYYKPNKQ